MSLIGPAPPMIHVYWDTHMFGTTLKVRAVHSFIINDNEYTSVMKWHNKRVSQMRGTPRLVANFRVYRPFMENAWKEWPERGRRGIIPTIIVEFYLACHRFSWRGQRHHGCLIFIARNVFTKLKPLTHCGLGTPYGDIDLGRHWLR